MSVTIEETYRIVPKHGDGHEIGLVAIDTSMSAGGLLATDMRLMLLPDQGLPEGEYSLQFVKKLATDQGLRRRSFPRLAVSNDRGPQ